jgi:Alcohol dehydrogenase GroES-like domain
MKAAVHTRYGPPEVIRISDVDKPAVTGHEVLVKVHATTVNRTDCGFRAAKPFIVRFFTGLIRPKVTVLGSEFAGVVEAVGRGVTAFRAGDRVFGFSEGRFGAHAEYLLMPDDGALATMPVNTTFEQAAPSTEGSHYALSYINAAKDPQRAARPGQWRHRSHRLGGGPAHNEPGRQRDRGLRRTARGTGKGPGRGPGHRQHG